jgi:ribosomal protein S18 acetylase RimI-like enzyme
VTDPPRRPATARPRSHAPEPDHSEAAAPTRDELAALERMHAELAIQADGSVTDDPELGIVWVRFPDRRPALNYAACVRWSADEADARLAEFERRVREAGEWPVMFVAETLSQPSDLPARLADAGWLRVAGERIMTTRHAPVVPHLDRSLRVEAVTPATALDCVRLEIANFDLPHDQMGERAERLARLVDTGQVRAFLLRLMGEPVASTRLTAGPGIASLTAVGATARHRRRGYGRMIAAVATRAGLATGHKLVWLSVDDENPGAVDLYSSLGFEPSITWSRWAAPAG